MTCHGDRLRSALAEATQKTEFGKLLTGFSMTRNKVVRFVRFQCDNVVLGHERPIPLLAFGVPVSRRLKTIKYPASFPLTTTKTKAYCIVELPTPQNERKNQKLRQQKGYFERGVFFVLKIRPKGGWLNGIN